MKNLRLLAPLTLIAALSACGGGKDSTVSAPTNFSMQAQDSQFYMSWDASPGVEYWVFCDPNQQTIDSHTSNLHPGRLYYRGIYASGNQSTVSYYATGVTNGTQYACTVNGRTDGGAGGPDAVPQYGTPGYAGSTWRDGNTASLSGMSLRSVAFGLPAGQSLTADQFVAVGTNGKLVVSSALDANASLTWGTPSQAGNATLNAVSFYTPANQFVAVGEDGSVAYSVTMSSWSSANMPDAAGVSMHAVTSTGSPLIAVGGNGAAQGFIYSSANGAGPWSQVSGIGSKTLRSVVHVPDATPYWIAVGDEGVVLRSTDGATWTSSTPAGSSLNFRGVAMLPVTNAANTVISYRVVAVADNGTVLFSSDGNTWSSSNVSGAAFVAVNAGKGQFMAIDSAGNAYTSNQTVNSWSWSSGVPTGLSSPLAVLRYTPNFAAVSNGWMVFDTAGKQRVAK